MLVEVSYLSIINPVCRVGDLSECSSTRHLKSVAEDAPASQKQRRAP